MSETDARMAQRHTSKNKKHRRYFPCTTKGFRGEALASIAAVAQVEQNQEKDTDVGSVIYIEGGELQFQEPVQTSEGSVFFGEKFVLQRTSQKKILEI